MVAGPGGWFFQPVCGFWQKKGSKKTTPPEKIHFFIKTRMVAGLGGWFLRRVSWARGGGQLARGWRVGWRVADFFRKCRISPLIRQLSENRRIKGQIRNFRKISDNLQKICPTWDRMCQNIEVYLKIAKFGKKSGIFWKNRRISKISIILIKIAVFFRKNWKKNRKKADFFSFFFEKFLEKRSKKSRDIWGAKKLTKSQLFANSIKMLLRNRNRKWNHSFVIAH